MSFLISIERVSFNFAFDVEMTTLTPKHIHTYINIFTNELIRFDSYFAICAYELCALHTNTFPHIWTFYCDKMLRDMILYKKLCGKKNICSSVPESRECEALVFIYASHLKTHTVNKQIATTIRRKKSVSNKF